MKLNQQRKNNSPQSPAALLGQPPWDGQPAWLRLPGSVGFFTLCAPGTEATASVHHGPELRRIWACRRTLPSPWLRGYPPRALLASLAEKADGMLLIAVIIVITYTHNMGSSQVAQR